MTEGGRQAGQREFGVGNLEYDLVAALAHLLEAEGTFAAYARDAEQAGDQACAELFGALRQQHRDAAQQVRGRLAKHLGGG